MNLKDPNRKGYAFNGWYTGSDFKTKIATIKKNDKKDYTLYAKWGKVSVGKASVSNLENSKSKQLTVKIEKIDSVKGYEITYATNSSFSTDNNTVTVTGTSKTIKNLQKSKTYYVKVRAYKVDSAGTTIYG